MICDFGCGKEAIHQFKTGRWCCSVNTNSCEGKRKKDSDKKKGKIPNFKNGHPRGMLGKHSWNAGLTQKDYSDEIREILHQASIKGGRNSSGKGGTEQKEIERKQKISKRMKEIGGGYREGSGRGKKGRYKGYWCDSSWELAWVIYHLENNIKFERNWKKFPYEYEGKVHYYIPDFILESGEYVEIKGYDTDQAKAKIAAFPEKIFLIKNVDMQKYLEYTTAKYGKDFVVLYE